MPDTFYMALSQQMDSILLVIVSHDHTRFTVFSCLGKKERREFVCIHFTGRCVSMPTRFWKRFPFYAVPVVLFLILVVCSSWLSRGALYVLVFALLLSSLVAVACLSAPLSLHAIALPAGSVRFTSAMTPLPTDDPLLPCVPTSAREAHSALSDEAFEYLAGAVVMARDGCRFQARVGGSGDQGIDVRLCNLHGFPVVVQAKRYDPANTVPSHEVRGFSGSLGMENAVYSYFVTTASLTTDGNTSVRRSAKTIHVIDGPILRKLTPGAK